MAEREIAHEVSEQGERHREQALDSLIGQEELAGLLRRMIERDRLPHALLFHGPPQVGKRSMAYALVRRLECHEGGEDFDCACRVCRKLRRGSWYDLTELAPETKGQRMIRVETIREKEDFLAMMPLEGRRRFLLIHDADRMNAEASNAFLKTLEEPPAHLHIVLLTDRWSALSETIRSRCTALRFRSVERSRLAEWLREMAGGDPVQNSLLAALAEGSPGRALELLHSDILARRQQALESFRTFTEQGYRALFKTAYELNQASADDPAEMLWFLLSYSRDMLVTRVAPNAAADLLINADLTDNVSAESERQSTAGLLAALEKIAAGFSWSGRMVNRQLALENLLLDVGAARRPL
jgi:DNA polymerase-3 subunit delta'